MANESVQRTGFLSRFWAKLTAERDVRVVLMLSVLPWVLVLAAVSSIWVTLIFLGVVIALIGIGSLLLSAFPPFAQSSLILLLTPACGFVVLAGALSYSAHIGVAIGWVFVSLIIIGILAAIFFSFAQSSDRPRRIDAGWLIVIVAAMACLFCFLPSAMGDAVKLKDGSFRWMYPDTQFFMANAASLKANVYPPRMPGLALEKNNYHIGAHAIAAAMSVTTGIELADAVSRVVRGLGQWAVILAAACLGAVLAALRGGARIAAPLSGFAFLFTGAITTFFAINASSASYRSIVLLFKIPFAVNTSGPFFQIMIGLSLLWGSLGLLSVISLLVVFLKTQSRSSWRLWPAGLIAVFLLASNGPAGLASIGLVVITAVIANRWRVAGWLFSLVLIAAGMATYFLLGYSGRSSNFQVDSQPLTALFNLMFWVFLGLGVKISAFSWLRESRVGVVLGVAVLGLMGFTLVFMDKGSDDIYGILFLESLLTIFAAAAMAIVFEYRGEAWRKESSRWIDSLIGLAFRAALLFTAATLFLLLYSLLGGWFIRGVAFLFVAALGLSAALGLLRYFSERLRFVRTGIRVALGGILFLQATAWVSPWVTIGLNLLDVDVVTSSGELEGLRALRERTEPLALCATNQHAIESIRLRKDKSYMYRALSERPFLLEGWEYGELYRPSFAKVRQDNEILFTTDDAGEFKKIVDKYGLDYIVAKPDTDIHLAKPLPPWLVEMAGTGTLRVYRIQGSRSDSLHSNRIKITGVLSAPAPLYLASK